MRRLLRIAAALCVILLTAAPARAVTVNSGGVTVVGTTSKPPQATDTPTPAPMATPAPQGTAGPVIVIPQTQPTARVTPIAVVEDINLDEEELTPAPGRTPTPGSAEARESTDLLGYVKGHWPVLAAAVGGVTVLVIALAVVIRLLNRKRRRRNPVAYGNYIESWLGKRGFAEITTVGRAAGDGVLITCRAPRGTRMAVLCVLSDGAVSYRTVQQADEEKDRCGCAKAAVVTNGTFSRQAMEGARALNIELMAEIE